MGTEELFVVGGGMAGMAAALVGARAGCAVQVLEQGDAHAEIGAGVQLGPNATRVLADWGLLSEAMRLGHQPARLNLREGLDGRQGGRVLASLTLGESMLSRYGSPYLTIHRADLHRLLREAAHQERGVRCHLSHKVLGVLQDEHGVDLETLIDGETSSWRAPAVLGCDGLWSRVRESVCDDGPPQATGHVAYRALLPMPDGARLDEVHVWMAPRWHAVHYPVRAGAFLNLVIAVESSAPEGGQGWDHAVPAGEPIRCLQGAAPELLTLVARVPSWRLWPVFDREPMRGPAEQVRHRVALLGDAAHPMRPYRAQGAAMALEDAWQLGRLLQGRPPAGNGWPGVFAALAQRRWRRNARVQAMSRNNGWVFHLRQPLRALRNAVLLGLGERALRSDALFSESG